MNGAKIEIRGLTMAFGSYVIMREIHASVKQGSVFVVMGNSGSGKSTLLRHMVGLQTPSQGDVFYDGKSFWNMDDEARRGQLHKCGVLFQNGALWSSMTLAENVELPLIEYTDWSPGNIREVARLKLALVGLNGFEDYYPSEISGGYAHQGRFGARHGAGPGNSVLRRTVRRTGSNYIPEPGPIDSGIARQPWRNRRGGDS